MKQKICKRCVMDNISTEITFDENGYCNYCTTALNNLKNNWIIDEEKLHQLVLEMKKDSKNKKYDCILGLSGGIDSCYTAYYLTKKFNVRILAVHVDAGWDTEVSVENIKKLCKKLKIDLKEIKMDYKEMYDLQRAYFLSDVINQDVPQDNAFFTELHKFVVKNDINWVAEGQNYSSESILPNCWKYSAMDSLNLKSIYKKYGRYSLKKFKPISFYGAYVQPYISNKLKIIKPLMLINYNKEEAIKILEKEIGFKYYGSKHSESIFTRLYQGYILPKKFGVVKAKAHLSSLIVAEQLTREKALKLLKESEYEKNPQLLEDDINKFIEKIEITREEFDEHISNQIIRSHNEFRSTSFMQRVVNHFIRKLRDR